MASSYYNEEDVHMKPMKQHELPRDKCTLDHNFGFAANKANNIHVLDEHTILSGGKLRYMYKMYADMHSWMHYYN